ncbi:MAG: hypothetical protein PVI01_16660 [Gemmatimonadales bacterium]
MDPQDAGWNVQPGISDVTMSGPVGGFTPLGRLALLRRLDGG